MFSDLVKAQRQRRAAPQSQQEEELDDNRLRALMDELFAGEADEDEELDKGRIQRIDTAREDLRKEMISEDEDQDLGDLKKEMSQESEDEDQDQDQDTRRELMDQVYSLIDDLSEAELEQIVSSRAMKKGLAMMLFRQAPTSDLQEFVSTREAQGEAPHESAREIEKAQSLDDDLDSDYLA